MANQALVLDTSNTYLIYLLSVLSNYFTISEKKKKKNIYIYIYNKPKLLLLMKFFYRYVHLMLHVLLLL